MQDCGADPIHARMLDELRTILTRRRAVSLGFYKAHGIDRSRAVGVLYPGSNKTDVPRSGAAAAFGLPGSWIADQRKASTYAEAELTLTGEPGTIVPAGNCFATEAKNDQPSIEFAAVENCILDEEGNGTVLVRALLDGKQSNVNAGTIVLMSEPVEGIRTVTNKERPPEEPRKRVTTI